jgi:hypothetical protein
MKICKSNGGLFEVKNTRGVCLVSGEEEVTPLIELDQVVLSYIYFFLSKPYWGPGGSGAKEYLRR